VQQLSGYTASDTRSTKPRQALQTELAKTQTLANAKPSKPPSVMAKLPPVSVTCATNDNELVGAFGEAGDHHFRTSPPPFVAGCSRADKLSCRFTPSCRLRRDLDSYFKEIADMHCRRIEETEHYLRQVEKLLRFRPGAGLQLLVYERTQPDSAWLEDIINAVLDTYLGLLHAYAPWRLNRFCKQHRNTCRLSLRAPTRRAASRCARIWSPTGDALNEILIEMSDRYATADAFYENVDLSVSKRLILLICRRPLDNACHSKTCAKPNANERDEIVKAYETRKRIAWRGPAGRRQRGLPFTSPRGAESAIEEPRLAYDEYRRPHGEAVERPGEAVTVIRSWLRLPRQTPTPHWNEWQRPLGAPNGRAGPLACACCFRLRTSATKVTTSGRTGWPSSRQSGPNMHSKMESLFARNARNKCIEISKRHIEPIEERWREYVKELELLQIFFNTWRNWTLSIEELTVRTAVLPLTAMRRSRGCRKFAGVQSHQRTASIAIGSATAAIRLYASYRDPVGSAPAAPGAAGSQPARRRPLHLAVEYSSPSKSADVEWQRNGRPLHTDRLGASGGSTRPGYSRVTCDRVTVDDAGDIACLITRRRQRRCHGDQLPAPSAQPAAVMSRELQSIRVLEGEPILLQCQTTGLSAPGGLRHCGGQSGRNRAVKVPTADRSHAGVYKCRQAATATLEKRLCGYGHVFRDSQRLFESPPRLLLSTRRGNSTCTIDPLRLEDAGLYSCSSGIPAECRRPSATLTSGRKVRTPRCWSQLMDANGAGGIQHQTELLEFLVAAATYRLAFKTVAS
uniref:Ig-like domain-containing protein n=1 Tax=Macrostomum lignano TaxID=282301 RepID=A0A1I8FP49_9PLAT